MKKDTSYCRIETTVGGISMSRQYTKIEPYAEEIFRRKGDGETYREIGRSLGLSKEQVKGFVKRQHRKARQLANGYIPLPKGRPRKDSQNTDIQKDNEIAKLKMQVELLRNFQYEAGRK